MIMKHLFTLLFLVPALWVQAQTVSIEGGDTYQTIQGAINAAQDGDVIDISGVHEIGAALSIPKTFDGAITLRGSDPSKDRLEGVAFDQTINDVTHQDVTNRLISVYQPDNPVHLTIENLGLKNGNANGTLNGQGNAGDTRGGAVYVNQNFNGSLSITNCVVDGNQGSEGGAIASLGCDVSITDSTIKNSVGTNGGGMIFTNAANNPDMVVNISRSLITGNTADNGGGVYVNGNNGSSAIDLNIENTTIFSNAATTTEQYSGGGGAIWVKAANNSSNVGLKLVHVTIDNNTHGYVTGAGVTPKAGLAFAGGQNAATNVEVYNSIIVNGDDVKKRSIHWAKTNPINIVNSVLGGLEGATAANVFLDDTSLNNKTGRKTTFAGIATALSSVGGSTQVLALGSSGANTVNYCTAATTGITLPTVDQRGYNRDATPDAGAFEFGGTLGFLVLRTVFHFLCIQTQLPSLSISMRMLR